MTPHRVQRRRTKGFRLPPGVVSVTRPGPWGNPFRVGHDGITSSEEAVKAFAAWLEGDGRHVALMARQVLRGKSLACWCGPDKPCHADVLLRVANAPDDQGDYATEHSVDSRGLPIRLGHRVIGVAYADVPAMAGRSFGVVCGVFDGLVVYLHDEHSMNGLCGSFDSDRASRLTVIGKVHDLAAEVARIRTLSSSNGVDDPLP